MNFFLSAALVLLPVAVSAAIAAALGYYWHRSESRYPRQSPLTHNLLRPAGYSLRLKMREVDEELSIAILAILLLPLMTFAVHVSQTAYSGKPETAVRIATSGIAALAFSGYYGSKLLKIATQRKWLALGLEGEVFTAAELDRLMLDGCHVFHDVPFEHGNIDHVVVSCSGVYSVNTKMVGKSKTGEGKADVTVDHEQGFIRFPDRSWRIPMNQLEGEAGWLSRFLSDATALNVQVEPMLALPGWYIKERIGRGPVCVVNPISPQKFFVRSRQVFTAEQIQRIAHQLDQKCRDVKPTFRENKRWGAKDGSTA